MTKTLDVEAKYLTYKRRALPTCWWRQNYMPILPWYPAGFAFLCRKYIHINKILRILFGSIHPKRWKKTVARKRRDGVVYLLPANNSTRLALDNHIFSTSKVESSRSKITRFLEVFHDGRYLLRLELKDQRRRNGTYLRSNKNRQNKDKKKGHRQSLQHAARCQEQLNGSWRNKIKLNGCSPN